VSEVLQYALTFVVVLNPPGAMLWWQALDGRFRPGQLATAAATLILVLALLVGGELIDTLDMAESSAQVAAGLLLIVSRVPLIVRRDPFAPSNVGGGEAMDAARLALWLATPAAIVLALFYGADRDDAPVFAGILVAGLLSALAMTWIPDERLVLPLRELGRVLLAVAIVIGVDLIIDGVTAV
jgi:small neutral amino acid transporter SnatA (MarC family)